MVDFLPIRGAGRARTPQRSRVADASERLALPCWLGRLLYWLPLAGLLALTASLWVHEQLGSEGRWLYRRGYDLVMGEDGPVEWLQVLLLFGSCVAAARLARRADSGRAPLGWWGLATLFGLAALEEISWGQRLFGVETPEAVARVNGQGELTLHNLRGLRPVLNSALVVISLAGLWTARRCCGAFGRLLAPWFAVTPLYWIVRATVGREPAFAAIRNAEWVELCLAAGVLGTLVALRRERRSPATARSVDTRRSPVGGASGRDQGAVETSIPPWRDSRSLERRH